MTSDRFRLITPLLGLLFLLAAASPSAAAPLEDDAGAFIRALADKAVQSLTVQDIPRADRVRRFRELLSDHFAVASIAKWVLGRHWRQATDAERREYFSLFKDLMVATYVDRFAEYAGETLKTVRTAPIGADTAMVFSEISRPGQPGPPLRVDWRVARHGESGFKILDVMVEGTSLSQTLRSDFASTIRQEGGTMAGLLGVMRAKTEALHDQLKTDGK